MKNIYYIVTLFMLLLTAKASALSASDMSWFIFDLILQ